MAEEKKKLPYVLEKKNGWEVITSDEREKAYQLSDKYISFMSKVKTEREFVKESIRILEEEGFVSIDKKESLKPGDKVYWNFRNKFLTAAVVGKDPVSKGVNIVASHVDVPHIDIKPYPIYEDSELAYINSHYYGGIKKFTWPAIPLALHGVVVKSDGEVVEVVIGEDESDPVLTITDIAIHIARKIQLGKNISEAVPGENLDPLVGSVPDTELDEKEKDKVKKYILKLLYNKYGITEEDLVGAELQLVPAWSARYVGLDKGAIGAFGHDDRVCGYTSLAALLDIEGVPQRTAIAMFFDKEEIGSVGNTSSASYFVDRTLADLLYLTGESTDARTLMLAWDSTAVLSADVDAAYDPLWKGAYDPSNSPYLGYGVTLTKYTGSGGKYHANDAHAEFYAKMKKLFKDNSVVWQTGELGKVDEGGGGTVAGDFANRGADVVDIGPAVLGLHTPFEVVSVIDTYYSYKAFKVFYEKYTK
ncbi:MAG: aminopeptidase [Dictyoglomi bacterium]|nr:aminopeptidase [Dictyoglomota bacterium]